MAVLVNTEILTLSVAVVQKVEFRPLYIFLYPSKLQPLEINSHVQVSLGPFPGRLPEALADT